MNLDDLTIQHVRELFALAASLNLAPTAPAPKPHPWLGRYVLVRTYSAGVHVGVIDSISESGSVLTLRDARRIWSWDGARLSCSEVATTGPKPGDKIAVALPDHQLNGAIEIIPIAAAIEAAFRGVAPWTR